MQMSILISACFVFSSLLTCFSVCSGSGILNSSSGVLQSDGYPDKYPYNTRCDWQIIAPPRNQIKLTFQHFDLEYCLDCNCDYVAVHDGLNAGSPRLGQYCTSDKPPSVLSTGRYMFVKFRSDLSSNHQGFRASYVSLPQTGGIYIRKN